MNLPSILNIELTNKCNKTCYMCGRRKVETQNPNIKYTDEIDLKLLKKIAKQLPEGILIQFHNNGEPLLYSYLKEALSLFKKQIRCFDTNGKLLLEKYNEIIDNVETITISTFEKDPEWEQQYEILKEFLRKKGEKKPSVIIRCLGDIEKERIEKYKELNCLMAYRILHSPMGSFEYKKQTVIPEHGICLEMLFHPAINVKGELSTCVRFDPDKKAVLGNLNKDSFKKIWNSNERRKWLQLHINGERNKIPLCSKCEFYGIPRG